MIYVMRPGPAAAHPHAAGVQKPVTAPAENRTPRAVFCTLVRPFPGGWRFGGQCASATLTDKGFSGRFAGLFR